MGPVHTTATWIARLALAVPMGVHGSVKITERADLLAKFDALLTPALATLATLAELGAAAGIVLGGLALNRNMPAAVRTLGLAASWLAVAAIAAVQIPAIVLIHWPQWMYFSGGMEYNLVLLALGAIVALGSWAQHQQRRTHGPIHR